MAYGLPTEIGTVNTALIWQNCMCEIPGNQIRLKLKRYVSNIHVFLQLSTVFLFVFLFVLFFGCCCFVVFCFVLFSSWRHAVFDKTHNTV